MLSSYIFFLHIVTSTISSKMDPGVESLGKSTNTPVGGTSLLDTCEENTSLATLIANFPSREATKSTCSRWIVNLAATRELADELDQSVIHCLGRDLWSVRSAFDAMVLLSDQPQMTGGMKLLLARDIEAVATQVRFLISSPLEVVKGKPILTSS